MSHGKKFDVAFLWSGKKIKKRKEKEKETVDKYICKESQPKIIYL